MYILIVLFEKRCAHALGGRSGGFRDTRQPTGVRVRREYSHGLGIFSFRKRVHPFSKAHGKSFSSDFFFSFLLLLIINRIPVVVVILIPCPGFCFVRNAVRRSAPTAVPIVAFPLIPKQLSPLLYRRLAGCFFFFCLRACTD